MTANSPRPADRRPFTPPRLYAIVDVDLCRHRGEDPHAVLSAFVHGGARLLQVRQKTVGSGALLELARHGVEALGAGPGILIVNDRPDIAAMANAHGVHVGQQDLPPAAVRPIIGSERWIGISTHTPEQIDEAAALDVDYIAVGPVFRTATKDTGYDPRGLELIRFAASTGKPVVGIGGITLERATDVIAAGAASVAVISDLLEGGDPKRRVAEFLARL